MPQKAGVLPQFPFTEQQFPNTLPLQVAPLTFAPQRPSVEIGTAGCVEVMDVFEVEVEDVVLFETNNEVDVVEDLVVAAEFEEAGFDDDDDE